MENNNKMSIEEEMEGISPIEKAISKGEYYKSIMKGIKAKNRIKKAIEKVTVDDWLKYAKEIGRSRFVGDTEKRKDIEQLRALWMKEYLETWRGRAWKYKAQLIKIQNLIAKYERLISKYNKKLRRYRKLLNRHKQKERLLLEKIEELEGRD